MTRRSEREIERALDALDDGSDLPPAGLITILSTEYNGGTIEPVDGEPQLVRVNGDFHRIDTRGRLTIQEDRT